MGSIVDSLARLGARLLGGLRVRGAAPGGHRPGRRRLLQWALAGLVLMHQAARSALLPPLFPPHSAPRGPRRSGRELWINPAGSNTPPWSSEEQGAPDFATIETAVGAGDEIILSDGTHAFDGPVQLFPNNLRLAPGDSVFIRSKSRDAGLCRVAASGAPARLLDLDFGGGAPDGRGLSIRFEGIHFENKVASGNRRGQLLQCLNDVAAVAFTHCAFSFALPDYDGSSGSRQCIDFTDTAETRTVLFDGCDFDDITVAGTTILRAGTSGFLEMRGCRLGRIDCSWSDGELLGAFASIEGGAAIEDLRVEGPVVVRGLGAATVLRGGLFANRNPQPVTIDGGEITGIAVDLSATPEATCTGVFLYCAGNTTDAVRHCSFHGNVRVGVNTIIGGLVCVKDDGHRVTVEDCEAWGNTGFYGALAYCTTGGAFDVRRCRAWSNVGGFDSGSQGAINGLGIYVGGGAYDCTIDSVVLNDHGGARGPALLIRNSDTPANPAPRTVTLRHLTVTGSRSADPVEPGAVHIQASDGNELTVDAINCVFDNPECGLEISAVFNRRSPLNLAFTSCFTPHGSAVDVETPNGAFSDQAPLTGASRLDPSGRPYADSQLVNAGADTLGAVPADAEGTPWSNPASPTVGGLEAAAADAGGGGAPGAAPRPPSRRALRPEGPRAARTPPGGA